MQHITIYQWTKVVIIKVNPSGVICVTKPVRIKTGRKRDIKELRNITVCEVPISYVAWPSNFSQVTEIPES